MKKLIVFEEQEFENLLTEFVKNWQEYSNKGYGCTLINNENKKEINDFNTLCGSFLLPWNETFKDK
jgi:CTP:phosphocholine cytidylyltransferase-like protein